MDLAITEDLRLGQDAPVPASAVPVLLALGAAICAAPGGPPPGAAVHERVAGQVVDLNARIAVLAATADAVGCRDLRLPRQLKVYGRSLAQIGQWCHDTALTLPAAHDSLRLWTLGEARRVLALRVPPLAPEVLTAARTLAADHALGPQLTHEQIRRRFGSLDPNATPDEVVPAMELAAKAAAARSDVAARSYADQLIAVVREVNQQCARRREGALVAARHLQLLDTAERHAVARALADRLNQVVSGDILLSADLHDAAERLRCQLEAAARHCYLSDRLGADSAAFTEAVTRMRLTPHPW